MKIHVLTCIVMLALFLVPYVSVCSQNRVDYTIQIDSDGSATWIIKQTVGFNETYDDLFEFQNRLIPLVDAAMRKTARGMTVDKLDSIATNNDPYVMVEYRFNWGNFSRIEDKNMVIGDVFQVEDFFLQLYGDGEVQVTYPSEYFVERVSPSPHERDDSLQTLRWLGTEGFSKEGAGIVLTKKSVSSGFIEALGQNAIIFGGLAVLVAGSSLGFYVLRRRKSKGNKTAKTPESSNLGVMESDDEKIVKLLKSCGGSLRQSAIKDHCRFSKAKTSQLLTVLENRGIVSRYKKGRDKIVVLVEHSPK